MRVIAALALTCLASCTLLYTKAEHADHPVSPPESAAVDTEPEGDSSLWVKVGASVAALLGGGGAAWKMKRGKG